MTTMTIRETIDSLAALVEGGRVSDLTPVCLLTTRRDISADGVPYDRVHRSGIGSLKFTGDEGSAPMVAFTD